jgi:hypothetical protein
MQGCKLRILALHGFRENASRFRGRLRGLLKRLQNDVEIDFVEAPHILPPSFSESKTHEPEKPSMQHLPRETLTCSNAVESQAAAVPQGSKRMNDERTSDNVKGERGCGCDMSPCHTEVTGDANRTHQQRHTHSEGPGKKLKHAWFYDPRMPYVIAGVHSESVLA